MNANLIFKWLKDPRFAPPGSVPASGAVALDGVFLPVEVDAPPMGSLSSIQASAADGFCSVVTARRVDITLSDGRRVLVEGPTALSAILGLVQGLMA